MIARSLSPKSEISRADAWGVGEMGRLLLLSLSSEREGAMWGIMVVMTSYMVIMTHL